MNPTYGWPTEDCQIVFLSFNNEWKSFLNGTYKLSYSGQASVTKCCFNGSISNVLYNSNTNITTADVIVNTTTASSESLTLQFKNVGSGIQNIKLIRPNQNSNDLFTKEFKAHLNRFSVLRFMDWNHANGNKQTSWGNRLTSQSASQYVSGKSVSYEYIAQLANELNKDVWLTIPVLADDNYVLEMANLFKLKLNAGINIYIEYSNELWNGGFAQLNDNLKLAMDEVATGNSTLDDPDRTKQLTPADSFTFMFRRIAKRGMEIGNIFRTVFNEVSPFGRVRPVLAGQYVNSEPIIATGLRFINQYYGKPNQFFYAIASAPYFNCKKIDNASSTATKQEILNELKTTSEAQYFETFNATSTGSKTFDLWISRATFYGLKNIMYEGGPDTFGPKNIQAKRQSQEDIEMKDILYKYYYNYYKTTNNDGFAVQFHCGASDYNTQYGTWGLAHNFNEVETAFKTQAIDSLLKQTRPEIQVGWNITGVNDSIDSRKFSYNTFGSVTNWDLNNSCKCNQFLSNGGFNGYLLNVKAPGKYKLSLNTQRPMSNGKKTLVDVYLNNIFVDSIVVMGKTSSQIEFVISDSILITFNIGLNGIELRYRGENTGNKAIYFKLVQAIEPVSINKVILNKLPTYLIFPQPAQQELNISFESLKNDNFRFITMDILGNKFDEFIFNEKHGINKVKINTENYKKGIYFLIIQSEKLGNKTTQKFVIE